MKVALGMVTLGCMGRVARVVAGCWVLAGCAAPGQQVTYDRYDARSSTYVNDTAGFALVFGRDWRVNTDANTPGMLFKVLPVFTGTEVTLKAVAEGIGLWVETTHVAHSIALDQLQPVIYRNNEEYFRQYRYQPVSMEKKEAHGIEYVEWVYHLRSPDRDDTMVEALFLRAGYAVRIRARTTTDRFDDVKGRIERLLGSLTAVDAAADALTTQP